MGGLHRKCAVKVSALTLELYTDPGNSGISLALYIAPGLSGVGILAEAPILDSLNAQPFDLNIRSLPKSLERENS